MFIHGYNADNLLVSLIASILKDLRSSLSKIVIIIEEFHCVVQYVRCSDMQSAFKSSHDTTLYTTILKETVSYYLNRGSYIYACMLDASKAFDKVHFGKLFNLLIDRKMPLVVI